MYKHHPSFKGPDDENVKIWRYMDFTKFLSLLDKESLHFSRTDLLEDKFEGSLPKSPSQKRIWHNGENSKDKKTPSITKFFKYCSYICSFYMNNFESAAMWQLYSKTNKGIAIQSTFRRLCECFTSDSPDIYIGEVNYIDYNNEDIDPYNLFNPFVHKRKSFEFENELRAYIFEGENFRALPMPESTKKFIEEHGLEIKEHSMDELELSRYIKIDLTKFIENIYIAPNAPIWYHDLVQSMVDKFELDTRINQSSLDEDPLF